MKRYMVGACEDDTLPKYGSGEKCLTVLLLSSTEPVFIGYDLRSRRSPLKPHSHQYPTVATSALAFLTRDTVHE